MLSDRGIHASTYTSLPIAGHTPIRAPGIYRWITESLAELANKDSERLVFIETWTSLIVWLLRDWKTPPDRQITSVAIPLFPHCTFLTERAIIHIPPKVIVPAVTYYALQENLFHEALHQQLSATLIFEEILTEDWKVHPQIDIPWRNASWRIDRVLHAAWVYSRVTQMRIDELMRGPEGGMAVISTLLIRSQRAWVSSDY